ncbi:MAG TPA: class I SAM-dependent methyltransferase [Ktedonosporobacter sp.]|nr:class I SAM-dependent methyltransferase [Ktedonosporobacter sp.]
MKHPSRTESVISPLFANLDALTSRGSELIINAQLHQQMLQVQGGRLCPEIIPINRMKRVLDLGCGAGEWIFDLAKRYPQLHIYGIDIFEDALNQAKMRRNIGCLHQVELRQMDLLHPLPIPDRYLDLVHIRRCASFITQPMWPHILGECVRILKPRGWLVLVEIEIGDISSPACQAIHRATLAALAKLGRTMDPTGLTFGAAQHLYGMLLQTPLDEVTYNLSTIDLGFMSGTSGRVFLTEILRQASFMKPVIIQQGILNATSFDELLAQAGRELLAPDLCGWAIIISAYGRQPERDESNISM